MNGMPAVSSCSAIARSALARPVLMDRAGARSEMRDETGYPRACCEAQQNEVPVRNSRDVDERCRDERSPPRPRSSPPPGTAVPVGRSASKHPTGQRGQRCSSQPLAGSGRASSSFRARATGRALSALSARRHPSPSLGAETPASSTRQERPELRARWSRARRQQRAQRARPYDHERSADGSSAVASGS
jgi:hypothetical protein